MVHHNFDTASARLFRGGLVDDAELHPDDLWQWHQRQSLVHHAGSGLRIAENIDHVDREGHVGEPRIDRRAMDRLPGKAWIDTGNPIAMMQKKGEDAVR